MPPLPLPSPHERPRPRPRPQNKVYSHQGDACGNDTISLPLGLGTLQYTGLSCPLSAGSTVDLSLGVTIPNVAPSGSYTFEMLGKASSGANVFCLTATIPL